MCLGELREQGVTGPLQLGDAGDVGLGRRGGGGAAGRDVAHVGGELGLEPADLAAQLVAHGALVALQLRVRQCRHGLGFGRLRQAVAVRRHQPRADGGDDRKVAGVGPGIAGGLDRLERDPLQVTALRRPLGDEGAEAVTGDDDPVTLELGVDGADRVDVDVRPFREPPHAWQGVPRREPAAGDERPQAPADLHADRQLALVIDREGVGRVGLGRLRLCHHARTVQITAAPVKWHSTARA